MNVMKYVFVYIYIYIWIEIYIYIHGYRERERANVRYDIHIDMVYSTIWSQDSMFGLFFEVHEGSWSILTHSHVSLSHWLVAKQPI